MSLAAHPKDVMRRPMRWLSSVLVVGSVAYLTTAVVRGEGGPGIQLVWKPFHGVVPFYGGGEEGSWMRRHPGSPLPWWMRSDAYRRIWYSDDEGGPLCWHLLYMIGYLAVLLGWLSLIVPWAVRRIASGLNRARPVTPKAARSDRE